MPDKAPTCADAQTVAGAPAGADVNMETGAGSPTGAVAATDALTGPPAAVSATAAAVPLLRGLSQDNSSLSSITGWGEGGKLPDIKDWPSIKHLLGPKPMAEDMKKEVIWRSQHLNLNPSPAPNSWKIPRLLLWLFKNPAPPALVPPACSLASPAPASATGRNPDSAAKETRFTKNHCLVRLAHAICDEDVRDVFIARDRTLPREDLDRKDRNTAWGLIAEKFNERQWCPQLLDSSEHALDYAQAKLRAGPTEYVLTPKKAKEMFGDLRKELMKALSKFRVSGNGDNEWHEMDAEQKKERSLKVYSSDMCNYVNKDISTLYCYELLTKYGLLEHTASDMDSNACGGSTKVKATKPKPKPVKRKKGGGDGSMQHVQIHKSKSEKEQEFFTAQAVKFKAATCGSEATTKLEEELDQCNERIREQKQKDQPVSARLLMKQKKLEQALDRLDADRFQEFDNEADESADEVDEGSASGSQRKKSKRNEQEDDDEEGASSEEERGSSGRDDFSGEE